MRHGFGVKHPALFFDFFLSPLLKKHPFVLYYNGIYIITNWEVFTIYSEVPLWEKL